MRERPLRATWLVTALALVGCSQPPDLTQEIDEYANAVEDSATLVCDCYLEAGYASREECSDDLAFVGLGERQCIADVLEGSESEGQQYLECVTAAYDEYLGCLSANVAAGCGEGGVGACSDALTLERQNCTQLPGGVVSQINACTE